MKFPRQRNGLLLELEERKVRALESIADVLFRGAVVIVTSIIICLLIVIIWHAMSCGGIK